MLRLALAAPADRPLHILCLGAHSDDIEIGAGGTIFTLLERYPGAHVRWVVFSALGERAQEARASAATFLARAERQRIDLNSRTGYFPTRSRS